MLAVTVGNDLDVVNGDVSSVAALVADDGGDGISLREAVAATNNTPGADTIDFAPSVRGTIGLTNGELAITDDLTINGPGSHRLAVSGNDLSRVFHITGEQTDVAINHLTVSDGFVTGFFGQGAGIFNEEAALSLDHVVVKDNRLIDAPFGGGGGVASDGTLYVSHSLFDNNLATGSAAVPVPTSGGAILAAGGGGTAFISHTRFTGNHVEGGAASANGGAVANVFGTHMEINHSLFVGNSVSGDNGANGGAFANGFFGPTATISHSTFIGNSANGATAQGGAIANIVEFGAPPTLTVNHSAIVGNRVTGASSAFGGGIYNAADAEFTLSRSLVLANRASSDMGDGIGGGVYNAGPLVAEKAKILFNKASTSHDNVFGDLTMLSTILGTS